MYNIWTVAKREFKLYFSSPAAFLIIFMMLIVLGVLFYLNIQVAAFQNFVPGVEITLAPLATLFMLATPAVTARLLAEEQRMGTIELMLTAPVRDWELVVGKWLGAFLFFVLIAAITLVYPLALNQMIQPGLDQGPLISGYLGILLLASAMAGIGVAVSSFFSSQIAAFATTIGVLIFLWWIASPIAQVMGPSSGWLADVFGYLAIGDHYFNSLLVGVLDLTDIVFFASVTALTLFVATLSVEARRWR
jgi:ABC-2 type transport system permease protein